MNVTKINYFFKSNSVETYTFKRSEHEVILLKKLDDNKIFYNNITYEPEFFHYNELEHSIQFIYDFRDEFIRKEFTTQYKVRCKAGEFIPNILNPNDFISGAISEANLLLYWQYEILVKAYKYEFHYPLDYYIFHNRRTFADVFFDQKKAYDIDLLETAELIYLGGLENEKRPIINTFFEDWFYFFGWKAIKRVYPVFEKPSYLYYKDYLKVGESDFFRNHYYFYDQSTRPRKEWLIEYDEQKKYDEFDINCKTNSYYTRYKAYNEIYNKDYPEEKKFKTDLFHDDLTEAERQANYNNMINKEKKAKEKVDYVLRDGKYSAAVFDLFDKLIFYETVQKYPDYPQPWRGEDDTKGHDQDNHEALALDIDKVLYEILNDPRNILIMPLVDAYFQQFRGKGFYDHKEDDSYYLFYGFEKHLHYHLKYYDMTYERQYMLATKFWLFDEFFDIEDEEFEEHFEEEFSAFGSAVVLFIWLLATTWYLVFYISSLVHLPFNVLGITENFIRSYDFFLNKGSSHMFYGFELRAPRVKYHSCKPDLSPPERRRTKGIGNMRLFSYVYEVKKLKPVYPKFYRFPPKFYNDVNYTFQKKRVWVEPLFKIFLPISSWLNSEDFGLERLDLRLRYFGYDYNIYRLRIMWVEETMPRELQLFVPKIVDWGIDKVERMVAYFVNKKVEYRTKLIQGLKTSIDEFKYGPKNIRDINIDAKQEFFNIFGFKNTDLAFRRMEVFRTAKSRRLRRLLRNILFEHKFSNRRKRQNRETLLNIIGEFHSAKVFRIMDNRIPYYTQKAKAIRKAYLYLDLVYEKGPFPKTRQRFRDWINKAEYSKDDLIYQKKALAKAELKVARTAAAVEPAKAAIESAKLAAKIAAEEYEKVEMGANEAIRAKKKAVKAELAITKAERASEQAIKNAEKAVKDLETVKRRLEYAQYKYDKRKGRLKGRYRWRLRGE